VLIIGRCNLVSDFCVLCARLRISYLCISLVIGWVIQGANSLVFLTDRLNGKETDILFLFCVSAWIPWWCLWLLLHGWDDKNIRFSILILDMFKDQNFDDLCACLSQCKCMLSLFTVPKLSSCYVFLMHPCCFCLAVMTTTYISRC